MRNCRMPSGSDAAGEAAGVALGELVRFSTHQVLDGAGAEVERAQPRRDRPRPPAKWRQQ